jgi:AraC-like DNA-binding protein
MSASDATQWIAPPTDLAPFVNSVWRWRGPVASELPVYLPGVGAECFFHHGVPPSLDGRRLPRAYLLFNTARALTFQADGPVCFTALRIRAGRLRHLTAAAPAALCDAPLPLDAVWGRAGARLAAALADQSPLAAQAARLFAFVRAALRDHASRDDRAFEAALDALYYAPNLRIQALADRFGLSRRALERRFVSALGLSPKRFARLSRMQHVFRRLALSPGDGLLGNALDLGYYDQAHFVHEVEDLTACAPGRIVEQWRGKPTFYNHPSRPPVAAWDVPATVVRR